MPDKKISITVKPELVSAVDKYVKDRKGLSRSTVVEKALMLWYQQEFDREDREYYSTLSAEELAEERSWSEITTAAAEKIWE